MQTFSRSLVLAIALVAALDAAASSAPAAAPKPPAGRQVTGVVFDDANRNGRRDAGESGIAGVSISDLRDVVVTGSDGRYAITAASGAGASA